VIVHSDQGAEMSSADCKSAVAVAYLFLVSSVPTEHREVWERYFDGCPAGSYSVHVHAQAASPWQFVGSRNVPKEDTVHGALRFSYRMVKAQLRLYRSALMHSTPGECAPTWLQLLSSSTVPLSDCATVHARLAAGERRTYIDGGTCAANLGRHVCAGRQPTRYSPAAGGEFLWAPQWSTLLADDARLLLRHERDNELVWFNPKGDSLFGPEVVDMTVSDEHYLPNVLRDLGVSTQTATLTWISPLDSVAIRSNEGASNHTIQGIVEQAVQDMQRSALGKAVSPPSDGAALAQDGGGSVLSVFGNALSVGMLGSLLLSKAAWSMLQQALSRRSKSKRDEMGHPESLNCGAVADAARVELAQRAGFSFLRKATGNCDRLIAGLLAVQRRQGALQSAAPSARARPDFRDSVVADLPRRLPPLALALANHRRSSDEDLMLEYFVVQPLRWLDKARGGEDACSIGVVRDMLALQPKDIRRQSRSFRLAELMVSDVADLTTPPDILRWNYTAPLDILALLPGWGPEDACEAGQRRCGARFDVARADAQAGSGQHVSMFLGACVPSLCSGPALEETFHILRRAAKKIMRESAEQRQDTSEATMALLREFGDESRPLANIQIACAGDLLPPNHWRHMLAAAAAFLALALVPHVLPRRRPRPAATPIGALEPAAVADGRLGFADGLRVLAISTIVVGHIVGMTVRMGFWNLAGDGSSLSDLLGQGIDILVSSSMAVQTFNFLSAFFAWSRLLKGREALASAGLQPYIWAYAVRVVRFLPTLLSAYLLFPRLLFYLETSSSPSYFMLSDARQADVCGASGLARQIAILFFPYNMVYSERYENLCMPHGWFLAQDSNLFALTLMLHWGWTRFAPASDRALVRACALLWAAGAARLSMRVVADDVTVFSLDWFVVEQRAMHSGLGPCLGGILSAHLHSRGISFGTAIRGSGGARLLAEWAACATVLLAFAVYPVAVYTLHRTVPASNLNIGGFLDASVWHQHLTQSAAWALGNKLTAGLITTTTHTLGMMLTFFMCSGPRNGGLSGLMRRALSLDIFTLLAPYSFAMYMTNQGIIVLLIARAYQELFISGWKDQQHVLAIVAWMLLVCTTGGAALHHVIEDPWGSIDWTRVSITRSGLKSAFLPNPDVANGKYVAVPDSAIGTSKLDVAEVVVGAEWSPTAASGKSRLVMGEEVGDSRRPPALTRVQLLVVLTFAGFLLGRWSSPASESPCSQPPLKVPIGGHSHTKSRPRRARPAHRGTNRNASLTRQMADRPRTAHLLTGQSE
jgi:hypothetical protein